MQIRRLAGVTALALLLPIGGTAQAGSAGSAASGAQTDPPEPITHVDLLSAPAAPSPGLAEQRDATVLTRTLATNDATIVGLAWEPATDRVPTAAVRFHTADGWDTWTDVDMEADAGEGATTSDGMIAVGADQVEVRITGVGTAPLASAELMLVTAPDGPSPTAMPTDSGPLMAATGAPRVISRAEWGANEVPPSPDCAVPEYATHLERFVVHHTAGTNSYWGPDSAHIIRAIQKYHVEGRGWCDIGYNFLVDKYGQMFEGRRGGVEELVVGVHASGHNTGGVGISVLGNYVSIAPPESAVDALVAIIGWKSYLHGLDPSASSMKNGVLLPNVIGHRDVAATACPGSFWNRIAEIAIRARAVSLTYQPAFGPVTGTTGPLFRAGAKAGAWVPVPASVRMTVRGGGITLAQSTRSTIHKATVAQAWNGRVLGTDAFVEPGTYVVELAGTSTLGKTFSATTQVILGYPEGFVVADAPDVLQLPATAGGDTHRLDLADDLGISATDVTTVALRVCGAAPATVSVAPTDLALGTTVDPSVAPGTCGLVVVGVGPAGALDVTRTAGSGPVTVDGVGYLTSSVPAASFSDVGPGLTFGEDIQWIYAMGITTGYGDGTYHPGSPISREAMAAFLYRAAGWPGFEAPGTPTFADVPPSHPFYTEIEWLAAEGITTGTRLGDGTLVFAPAEPISRGAMAAFLFRMSGAEAPAGDAAPFTDVPAGAAFVDAIRWMKQTGISTGNPDGTYRPANPVARDAMAAFLHRSYGVA